MGFVVGYVPCGLSPQIDGMPVILKKEMRPAPFAVASLLFSGYLYARLPLPF
jgi:hypothetical protein